MSQRRGGLFRRTQGYVKSNALTAFCLALFCRAIQSIADAILSCVALIALMVASLARAARQKVFGVERTHFAALCAMFVVGLLMMPQRAEAHGAWLGNCQIDFSSATIAQIQANVDAGKSGVADGEFIEYIATCPVIVSGTLSGPGGYVTFYKPVGTEIAGTWIVNAGGTPINARPATAATSGEGISRGWGPQNQKTFVVTANGWVPVSTTACAAAGQTSANCNNGLAYIYGDTGIFYSTRADTAMFTGGATRISVTNGYQTDPTNATPWGTVGGAGNERVHNKWDAVQTNAFGAGSVIANGFSVAEETRLNTTGRGSTPFNAGSPVAGPDSGSSWDRYGNTGPWNRISYSGSCFANDPTIAGTEGPANGTGSVVPQAVIGAANSVSVCTTTTAGVAVGDASLLPSGTNAVRFAVGGITSGETHRVKVRLKVTTASTMGPVNFEAHGGDSTQGAAAGNDNPWRYWVGAPSVAAIGSVRLSVGKTIVAVNGIPYTGSTIPPNATVRYRVSYANVYSDAQTNVVLSDVLPSQATGTSNYTVISGPNIVPVSLPSSGTFSFQTIASLGSGMGGVIEYDVATNAATGATVTNTARINSTQLPTLQTDAVAATVITPVPIVAGNDSGSVTSGASGGTAIANVLLNDTLNGAVATTSTVTLTQVSTTNAGVTLDVATGAVNVAAGTAAGSYSVTYRICQTTFLINCTTAVASVTVPAAVDLTITKSNGVTTVSSGNTVTYTVTVTNTGPDAVTGALVTDTVGAGLTCPASNAVTITGNGVPAGSFTISNLTGAGIALGSLASGQSATLAYSCQVN